MVNVCNSKLRPLDCYWELVLSLLHQQLAFLQPMKKEPRVAVRMRSRVRAVLSLICLAMACPGTKKMQDPGGAGSCQG